MSAATTRPPCVYVCVCAVLHSSAQLVDYCATNEWAFIGSQLPRQHQHVVAIIIFYAAIHRHLQWPHKKAANKSERWFIQNTVRQTRRAWKDRGSYIGPMHQGRHKKEDYAIVWKMEGEIESKRRGNIVTQTQRLCVSGQILIWFPFFPPSSSDTTQYHAHKKSRRNKLANDWTHIPGPGFLLFHKNGTLQIEKKRWLLRGRSKVHVSNTWDKCRSLPKWIKVESKCHSTICQTWTNLHKTLLRRARISELRCQWSVGNTRRQSTLKKHGPSIRFVFKLREIIDCVKTVRVKDIDIWEHISSHDEIEWDEWENDWKGRGEKKSIGSRGSDCNWIVRQLRISIFMTR